MNGGYMGYARNVTNIGRGNTISTCDDVKLVILNALLEILKTEPAATKPLMN